MTRYLLKTDTNWCGEDITQGVITNNVDSLDHLFELESWDRFRDFEGPEAILQELFPDVEDYTDEQIAEAEEVEHDYFRYSIEEFDEDTHGKWEWYDLFLDDTEE